MQPSKIEWTNFSINPIKGLCPMDCKDLEGKPYCYARRMYKRFRWNPEIRYIGDGKFFDELQKIPRIKGTRIFIGSTIELFGDWLKSDWFDGILEVISLFPFFTFIFLTKCPQNLSLWSPYPSNVYIGVSVTNQAMHNEAIVALSAIQAKVKFISYEPLLSEIEAKYAYDLSELQWVIIGRCTPPSAKTAPKIEWIKEIEDACKKRNIPYFEKNNLKTLLGRDLIQNYPIVTWR